MKHENGHQPQSINVSSWERVLSAGTGTLILSKSLGRSLPGTVIGAALAYRGLSGHCHLYDVLSISTANGEHPVGQSEVRRIVTIDAPQNEVFDFFRNRPDRFDLIMTPLVESEILGDDRYRFQI